MKAPVIYNRKTEKPYPAKPYQPMVQTIKHDGKEYRLECSQLGDEVIVSTQAQVREYYGNVRTYTEYIAVSTDHGIDDQYTKYNPAEYAADLATVEKYFIGRYMSHKTDSLARWAGIDRVTHDWPEAVIMKAARLVLINHNKRIAHANKAHNHPIYQALKQIASQEIKCYRTDFMYHDALTLCYQPTQVLWQVDEYGTWMSTEKHSHPAPITKKNLYAIRYNPGTQAVEIKKVDREAAEIFSRGLAAIYNHNNPK